jgi:phage-related protein
MEYVTGGGRGVVTEWYHKELSKAAGAEFDDVLRYLAITPRDDWKRPEYAPLSGGISEVRFKADRKEFRPLGFFLLESRQYVLLIGASKKMKTYDPPDAKKTAARRMKEVVEGRARIRIYDQYTF